MKTGISVASGDGAASVGVGGVDSRAAVVTGVGLREPSLEQAAKTRPAVRTMRQANRGIPGRIEGLKADSR
jgi:hypothetical protein